MTTPLHHSRPDKHIIPHPRLHPTNRVLNMINAMGKPPSGGAPCHRALRKGCFGSLITALLHGHKPLLAVPKGAFGTTTHEGPRDTGGLTNQIGRASCRERV